MAEEPSFVEQETVSGEEKVLNMFQPRKAPVPLQEVRVEQQN
jgi:hypothetical protein